VNRDELIQALRVERAARRYRDELFASQRKLFDDTAQTKAAVTSRRAGKTWVGSAGLYDACIQAPGSINPYIALSAKSARYILWPILHAFNTRYGLGLRMKDHELTAHAPNGSQIILVGGDQTRKVEALRGGKYRRVVVDEAQAFPTTLLRYMIEDVLDASLLDLNGDTWLFGTPNAACAGHFHDLTTGKNPAVAAISTHHWTVLENPHIPHAADWLTRKRAERKWTEDNPTYRREYLGQWVRDSSSLVFRFDRGAHQIALDRVPRPSRCIAGVDLGTSEDERTTAIVVVGWTDNDKTTRVLYAKKYAALSPWSISEELKRLKERYPIDLIVLDEGGLGKGYGDEWRKREGLPVKAATKTSKLAYVEHCNGELDRGRILFVQGRTDDLIAEVEILQWDEERKEYDRRFADHASDAFLYAWRECWSFAEDPLPEIPAKGTRADMVRREEEAEEREEREIRRPFWQTEDDEGWDIGT